MNHNINLWELNKPIEFAADIIKAPIKKISNIKNQIFLLTSNNNLYKCLVEEDSLLDLTLVEKFKPLDIDSCKDLLFIVTSEGSVLICNEELTILDEINLFEDYKCSQGHSSLTHRIKVKSLAVNEYGRLFICENGQLWGSGCMPQIGINNEMPKKVVFFSGRIVYSICIGTDFAVAVVSKRKEADESESIFEESVTPVCHICIKLDNSPNVDISTSNNGEENGIDAVNIENILINKHDKGKLEKNIIFRNTEAAKEFLTRQISRMSSVGEEYLIECTEKPTRLIKENMTSVATFVYEGVKTVGDKVATLSRHVSSSSDCTSTLENNNEEILHSKNSKEDILLSVSQSTSEKDLSDMEVQEHIDIILNRGISLLNREVWMWGNIRHGCLGGADLKKELPVIVSTLSNLGVAKISLQNHHACALTLDGRAFIWGNNNYHQVSLESNANQMTPKLFGCNMNERVMDAICGSNFTVILTNKTNITYFGKNTQSYQTIYHRFMSEKQDDDDTPPVEPLFNLVGCNEYSLLNLGRRCDDNFNNFLVKEQIMLEEMLCVHQYIIRLLTKKASDSENSALYDSLCKSYIDMLYFLAASVESLIQHRSDIIILNDITIVRYFKEYISIYKEYVNVVQNVASINGFECISKLVPVNSHLYTLRSGILRDKSSDIKDISLLLLSPVKRIQSYTDFFRKFCSSDVQSKWKEFIEYSDTKAKEAEKTNDFWLNSGKTIEYLIEPKRRLICDSQSDPLNLLHASRFSSHRFILFTDIFAHINGSSSNLYSLPMIWLELPHHDTLHLICLRMPEETLMLVAPDGVTKNSWYHALQHAIKMALNKMDFLQPPLARSGTYSFTKSGFFKDATYFGKWLNAKMHGSGKLKWADGRTYTGHFNNNFLNGYGTMDTPNIGIYEGEWKENKQNGYGKFTYCNKNIYKGYFRDGVPHGHGLLRKGNFMANSASLYIGDWVSGKKSGYGVMDEISTGQKYLGCWTDCKKEGTGLIVTSEGTYYEGNFHNDLLSGHGIMVLEDGTHYEGEFKGTGIIGGKGILTLPSGHTIEGNLVGSMEEGIKINTGVFRAESDINTPLPKSFGLLCTPPSQKWKALFKHCHQVLGLSEQAADADAVLLETPRIWQNVAIYLSSASALKRSKGDDNSLQNSLNNLDVIPPFGRDKITTESYKEIKIYLNRAFESVFHPLGSLLNNLSEAYISSYSGKVHPILVNHAILEIIDLTKRVYDIIRYLFPALPTSDNEHIINDTNEEFEIVSYQSLLYPLILPKVYNCLCTLLTLKNENQEKQYKKVLIEWNKLSDRSLMSVLSVEKKFFNLDQCINLSDKSCAFVEAIETLQQIISMFLPIEKLIVIKNTVEKMTPVAQELLGDQYVWNMDDLFPLFLYVVVRARIPHLGAELEFMDNFMDRNLENGELGIMFTTLKACYQQILQDKSFIY